MWKDDKNRLALLELYTSGKLKYRRRQQEVYAWLEELPWTRATGRKGEIALADARENELLALLERIWPDWRVDFADLSSVGLKPTPKDWRVLQEQRGLIPQTRKIPEQLRYRVLRMDDFTCRFCGAKASEQELQVDHLVPWVVVRCHEEQNLLTSCAACNRGKSDQMLTDAEVRKFQRENRERSLSCGE